MKKYLKLAVAASAMTLSGTAHAQLLNQLLGKLLQPVSVSQPVTTEAPFAGVSNAGFAQPTPAQGAALDKLLNQRTADRALAQMLVSAKPILRRAIMASTCASSPESMNELNDIRMKPKSYTWLDKADISKTALTYHDARQCTTVARLTFKKLAANALEVEVYYISPSSHQADHQRMQFRNVAESGWLIDEIYMNFTS